MEEARSRKYWTIYDATEKIRPKIERWMRVQRLSKYNQANLLLIEFALEHYGDKPTWQQTMENRMSVLEKALQAPGAEL